MWKCIHIPRALWKRGVNPLRFLKRRANTSVTQLLPFVYETKNQQILQLLVMHHSQPAEFEHGAWVNTLVSRGNLPDF